MDIVVERGNVFEASVAVVALPANLADDRRSGVLAYADKLCGGLSRPQRAPELGDALWLSPGNSRFEGFIALYVRETLGGEVSLRAVERAMIRALEIAARRRVESLAFVGIGAGRGGRSHAEVAAAMARALKAHTGSLPSLAVLVDTAEDMVGAWRQAVYHDDRA